MEKSKTTAPEQSTPRKTSWIVLLTASGLFLFFADLFVDAVIQAWVSGVVDLPRSPRLERMRGGPLPPVSWPAAWSYFLATFILTTGSLMWFVYELFRLRVLPVVFVLFTFGFVLLLLDKFLSSLFGFVLLVWVCTVVLGTHVISKFYGLLAVVIYWLVCALVIATLQTWILG